MNSEAIKAVARLYFNAEIGHNVKSDRLMNLSGSQISFLTDNWKETKECIEEYLIQDGRGMRDMMTFLESFRKNNNLMLKQEEADRIYDTIIKKGRPSEIIRISESAGVSPSKPIIGEMWKRIFSDGWNYSRDWQVDDLEHIVKRFGKPVLKEGERDRIGNDWLRYWTRDTEQAKKGHKTRWMDGIEPKQFHKIISVIGGNPGWDMTLAEKAYASFLRMGIIHKELFNYLKETVKAAPKEEDVHAYYADLFEGEKNERNYGPISERIEACLAFTEKKPRKEELDDYYPYALTRIGSSRKELHSFDEIKKVERLTGIPITEKHTKAAYNTLLMRGDAYIIRELKQKTGISPSFDTGEIQEAYSTILAKGAVHRAMDLYLETDISPNQQKKGVVEKLSKELINGRENYETIRWLANMFPKETTLPVQSYIRGLILEKKYREAKYFLRSINDLIKPAVEEQFAIACEKADWKTAKTLLNGHKEALYQRYPVYAEVAQEIALPKEMDKEEA
ncbi:MAG: hypothetical protein V1866_05195 [archaeon]